MKITITETVRCWGQESSTYDIDMNMDELTAKVREFHSLEEDEEVTPSDINAYLTDEYVAETYDLDIKEITDRDSASMEVSA